MRTKFWSETLKRRSQSEKNHVETEEKITKSRYGKSLSFSNGVLGKLARIQITQNKE
jgi:hypothetical protein